MNRIVVLNFAWIVIFALGVGLSWHAESDNREAIWLDVDGAIGPATRDYVSRALDDAKKADAAIVILRMDTPGGLDIAMRDIIQDILVSPVPVVTYVSPSGARAASAGTYILYASHVAAMAPATTLGAATPVQIGGLPGSSAPAKDEPPKSTDSPESTSEPATPKTAMERKIINDAAAYIRGLAEMRGRNVAWAEKAVREAASLQAAEALKENVIDIVATDMPDLLKQLHGREVSVLGQLRKLDTQGLVLKHVEPDWRSKLLAIITDPNVAYILMLIGIYGLIFEFATPGAIVPGVVGAISLLLALFAFQVLPVNYAGLGLMLLGVILMTAEAFAPSFGALGLGGVIAFVIGSIILMDTDIPGYGISFGLIIAIAVVSSTLFTLILVMAVKAQRRKVVSGQEELLGAMAEVLADFKDEGHIRIHGETWKARSAIALLKGERVLVTKREGLTLWVKKEDNEEGT